MADHSAIEWTDATVNFWWGCTKVGPGCDHCYAERFDKRVGGAHWGLGAPRRKIKSAVSLIHRLDNEYAAWAADHACGHLDAHCGLRRRVFIQSMSDLFDLEVRLEWFAEAWEHIESCDRLDLQIVTKRISAVAKRLDAVSKSTWPQHAGLIVTVVDQPEAERDIPRLLALKKELDIPWIGLSIEPMLGPIDLAPWLADIDWVICGGESGPGARPMSIQWAREVRDQCAAASVPFFFKQWGAWRPAGLHRSEEAGRFAFGDYEHDRSQMIQVEHYPRQFTKFGARSVMQHVGKKAAGRLLDGVEHNAMPEASR